MRKKETSVKNLLIQSTTFRKRGYTNLEINLLVDKSSQAIQREITNLLKWNEIEGILLFLDEKTYILVYRILEK